MPADTSILMGFRGPQIESQDALNARAAQQMVAQQQNMLGAMQLGEMARANQQKNALREKLSQLPSDTSEDQFNALIERELIAAGELDQLRAHRKSIAEIQAQQFKGLKEKALTKQADAATAKSEYDLKKQQYDHGWESIGNARNPQEYRDKIYDALAKKIISQAEADSGLARLEQVELQDQIAGGNAHYNKFRMDNLVQLVSLKDRLTYNQPKPEKLDTGETIEIRDLNPNSFTFGKVIGFEPITKTMTPAQKELAEYHKGLLENAKRRLNEELATGTPLTEDTLNFAAQLYSQTGQMPPVGMGKNAQAIRAQILNRAAQINMGGGANAADAASNVVGNKIDVATKTKATKDFSTGIQGRQVTAFNTAIDHLATMDKLSDALQNNDIKLINSLGNIVARQTGKPAPTNFDAAKQIVTAEVIKAVVASGGGVTERQEAERNFAAANSPAQLKGLVRTYKELLGGQLNSLGVQYESTTGKKDFESKLTSDAKAEFRAVRGKGEPAAAPTGAVDTNNKWLKKN